MPAAAGTSAPKDPSDFEPVDTHAPTVALDAGEKKSEGLLGRWLKKLKRSSG